MNAISSVIFCAVTATVVLVVYRILPDRLESRIGCD